MTGLLPWPERTGRIVLEEVDSTMSEAARLAPELKQPTWIMALHQSAARGRRGRSWEMPKGNFAASFVFRPAGTAAEAALRSFSAAVALFEALALSVERDRLSLKWPNDVLLDGGKVAGILLESVGTQDQIDWLAIGFGVNLASVPEGVRDASFPPVSLEGAGAGPLDLDELLSRLAQNMATEEGIFAELGFAPIREKWLRHAARLGEVITARTARDEVTGVFETVDPFGQLVLRTPDGQVSIPAADVYF
ncbi:biotin--[acetyl-CoA-carboxylase] ligase [Silicimonas algicola]|uniref:biotin--[biotin carboxyl-carrier protein] ligase n=1 Tax=Silicimonas algicola TaxID=1826607 RepID=A0A316G9F5_9RHOB|nr:biotin--[acetyl-CoA-carboxylase] ligase [Silicimonas algicola]AZQ68043.1 biotin--[acetyl-CoA-carboxylase] ligase [Silicimonas algicola]PWK57508.1 BirA family biotin operon repressor/biotin-[acetyl-CoA-carboxylase] ligase [Silicimonas algicola]